MQIATYIDAPRYGGAERYFVELCNGLARRGVDVAAISPEGEVADQLRKRLAAEVELRVLAPRPDFDVGFVRNAARALPPFRELRALVDDLQPDLLHICNGGFPGAHSCRAAVFATRRPTVMTVNNRAQPRQGLRGYAYLLLDRALWASLDAVVCPSRATGAALKEIRGLPSHLLAVVYYGIQQPDVQEAEAERVRDELGADGQFLVGIVATPDQSDVHAQHKGHDVLLEALALCDRTDVTIAIVGHDPGESFHRRARELGVADRVALAAGFRETHPYMKAFDLLAVPSRKNEALPVVMLEAMAYGTPVVGSRLSGIPEAVIDGETGATFDPGDAAALASILTSLASDSELVRRLGAGARERYDRLFTVDAMVDGTLGVYDSVLRPRQRQSSSTSAPASRT